MVLDYGQRHKKLANISIKDVLTRAWVYQPGFTFYFTLDFTSVSMKNLTILSGAGINIGVSQTCPFADQMLNFSYQKISTNVYTRISPDIKALFSPESFDYILGGLMTVNLAIEKTKQDLKRFKMNEEAFADLFRQSVLQASIASALDQIENQLTISLSQMLNVVKAFTPVLDHVVATYNAINYFTVNFDGIFDHILYGPNYARGKTVTDFWSGDGSLNKSANQKVKIHHLHGDLRYKPFKKTRYNQPPYRWPVLVVGDQEVKKGLIAGQESLRFYNNRLRTSTESRETGVVENVLAIIGFGFRDEDEHIVSRVKYAITNGVFDRVLLFDIEDRLAPICQGHTWVRPDQENLIAFLARL
jgi:hypothetical protein